MTTISYKSAWQMFIDGEMNEGKDQWGMGTGFPGLMAGLKKRGEPFANWHLLAMPESPAARYLEYCLELSSIYPTHEYARTFLAWANEAADRALSDIRFTYDPDEERTKGNPDPLAARGWKIPGIFPGNHGSTLAAACFARAMRDNSALDDASLLQAAAEIAESALDTTSREWTDMPQSDYLRGVRLVLIAGRVDKAQTFFKTCRRKFKHTQAHFTWLQDMSNAIEAAKGGPLDEACIAAFQSFFDQVRDPTVRSVGSAKEGTAVSTNISLLRLELALIKQRFVLQEAIEGNWNDILGLISE